MEIQKKNGHNSLYLIPTSAIYYVLVQNLLLMSLEIIKYEWIRAKRAKNPSSIWTKNGLNMA